MLFGHPRALHGLISWSQGTVKSGFGERSVGLDVLEASNSPSFRHKDNSMGLPLSSDNAKSPSDSSSEETETDRCEVGKSSNAVGREQSSEEGSNGVLGKRTYSQSSVAHGTQEVVLPQSKRHFTQPPTFLSSMGMQFVQYYLIGSLYSTMFLSAFTDRLWNSNRYRALEISITECAYIQDFKPAAEDQVSIQVPNELTLDIILGPLDVKAETRKLRGEKFSFLSS